VCATARAILPVAENPYRPLLALLASPSVFPAREDGLSLNTTRPRLVPGRNRVIIAIAVISPGLAPERPAGRDRGGERTAAGGVRTSRTRTSAGDLAAPGSPARHPHQHDRTADGWHGAAAPGSSGRARGRGPGCTGSWAGGYVAAAARGAGCWRWSSGATGEWRRTSRRRGTDPAVRTRNDRRPVLSAPCSYLPRTARRGSR
jgi:hypothetical protein